MVAALTIYYKEAHRTTIPFSLGSTFIKEAHRTTVPFNPLYGFRPIQGEKSSRI
jgi:hypothetical protein